MPHIHIGLAEALKVYLLWVLVHTLVQVLAIWLHNTRIGQALAFIG